MWRSLDMWRLVSVIVVSLLSSVNAECPPQEFNVTGSFNLASVNVTEGDSCVFNITRSASSGYFTTLTLNNIVLAGNDSLVVYDGEKNGNRTVLLSLEKQTVVSQLAIAFNRSTIIEYTVTSNNTASSGIVGFDLEECRQTLTDSWLLPVESPLYLPGQGNVSCVYTINSALPEGRVAVVSFSQFSMQNESYVAFTSGNRQDNTSVAQRDFFTDPTANQTTIEFFIANQTNPQTFSLVFDTDVASCTEDLTITAETVRNLTLPDSPGAGYTCHLRVSSENNTLMLRVVDAALLTGLDSLTVLDGPTSDAALVSHISESTSDYLVLSSGSYLTLHLSLHARRGSRRMLLTFTPLAGPSSHSLHDNGTISLLAATPSNDSLTSDPVNPVTYWQLLATAGSVVRVNLSTELTANATLTYYDGLQIDESKIVASLSAQHQDLTVVTSGAAMLVVLADLPKTDNFTLTFDSVAKDCDQTFTKASGQLQYAEVTGDARDRCAWTLAPQAEQGVLVLIPQLLSLGEGDNVTIYSGLKGDLVLATFTSDLCQGPLPQLNIPATAGARVVVQDKDTGKSDMKISINYRVEDQVCGGQLAAKGVLTTPNFPNQYPVNADCEWTTPDSKQLFLSLDSVSLASGHNLSVVSNGTQLVNYDSNTTTAQLPSDFITSTNETEVNFSSPAGSKLTVSQGAKVKYWVLDCGGLVNKTDDRISYAVKNETTLCVWVVKVPSGNGSSVMDLNITINGTKDQSNVDHCLQIYDGPSIRHERLPSANASSQTQLQSKYDTIIVVFNHTVDHAEVIGFNLTFRSHKCNATCANGVCLKPTWRCNGINDCGDFTDEKNCSAPAPPGPTPAPKPAPAQDYSGFVKSGWIPACLFIGMFLGAVLLLIVPRIYRRMRGGGGNYARMSDHTPVVA